MVRQSPSKNQHLGAQQGSPQKQNSTYIEREGKRGEERERWIYYKELAHLMMEAEKSHNQPSVSWRTSRASGLSSYSKSSGKKPRKSQCFSCSPKAEKGDVPFKQSGRQSSLVLLRGSTFLFQPSIQMIGRGLPTGGGGGLFYPPY